MTFSRKRGRPRSTAPAGIDIGTPELIHKRAFSLTAEAIDICLERELISADEHWCAIHLRWLYTLRYGAPSVHAIDPTHMGGRECTNDNPEWRKEREREYLDALKTLGSHTHVQRLLGLCVFNQRPQMLHFQPGAGFGKTAKHRESAVRELSALRGSLAQLVKLWCKKKPG